MIKVFILNEEGIPNKILVFKRSQLDLNALYKTNPNHEEFSELILEDQSVKDKIIFVNQSIHYDDTIDTIKKKIILALEEKISYEEMYLFASKEVYINDEMVFNHLTQNETLSITRERLMSFLSNISDFDKEELKKIEKNETFSYDDILSLQINNKQKQKIPIGIKYNLEKQFPIYINPFSIHNLFETVLYDNVNVTTYSKDILMDYSILNNNLYLCLAEPTFKYIKTKESISSEDISKLYFPFLYNKKIIDLQTLSTDKTELVLNSEKLLNSKFKRNVENVNLFYDIQKTKENNDSVTYLSKGIKYINFVIHPLLFINIPIDIVIKLIKTNEKYSLIKYNPSRNIKSIFRLYTGNKISETGAKIPFLNKGKINKLNRDMDKFKSVSVYYNNKDNKIVRESTMTFFENGNIEVSLTCNNVCSKEEIVENVKIILNPLLKTLNNFLENSGFHFSYFENFSSNIEVLKINYFNYVNIKKNIILQNYIKCISSVFNIVKDDLIKNKEIVLDFKRVSNFNEMSSIDAFIARLFMETSDITNITELVNYILPLVKENFKLSQEDSEQKIKDFIDSYDQGLDYNIFENKKIKLKTNPGFNISFKYESISNNISILIENINNIKYLDTIPIYLDSLLHLTQETTNIPESEIQSLCLESSPLDGVPKNKNIDGVTIEEEEEEEIEEIEEIEDIQNRNIKETLLSEEKGEEESEEESEEEEEIFYQSESEEESEEESESESQEKGEKEIQKEAEKLKEETQKKQKTQELKKEIDNMPLRPYPIYKRLIERDPELFIKEQTASYNSYNRICPGNDLRQPIALTQEEKDNIDLNHAGSYDVSSAFRYGSSSDPKKQHWFICPRFWDLKNNVSLTEKEVKDLGGDKVIIPEDAKTVPKGKYILKIQKEKIHGTDENFKQQYPGLMDSKKHPKGLCLPCCFLHKQDKTTDKNNKIFREKKTLKEHREKCGVKLQPEMKQDKEEEEEEDISTENIQDKKSYVLAPNKFPLEVDLRGYLPINVQKILEINNTTCQISKINKSLKKKYPCLLRKGVVSNENQSFLECLADVYSRSLNKTTTLSLIEFKKIMIEKLTIDNFYSLQNGSLINTFYNKDTNIISREIEKYKASKLYQTILNIKNEKEKEVLFKRICIGFKNFKKYLLDNNQFIDYSYLWDFVSNNLFSRKINLVILQISEDDMTNKIDILCPTNHYSNSFFKLNNETLLILKKDNFYEPIYLFENDKTINLLQYFFKANDLTNNEMLQSLNKGLLKIQKELTKCKAINSSKNYIFKRSIPLINIIHKINTDENKNYNINKFVLNYNNKIIALLITNVLTKENIYIPCMPTGIKDYVENQEYTTIDDDSIWNTYETTIEELEEFQRKFDIPTKAIRKVVEQGLIVGLITETNQFVRLKDPEQNIYKDDLLEVQTGPIDTIFVSDRVKVDKNTLLKNKGQQKRLTMVKHIHMENKFFNSFRNTIQILLKKYQNYEIKQNIKNIINSTNLYYDKLRQVIKELQTLTNGYVIFKEMKQKEEFDSIVTCINKTCENIKYCEKINDKCVLTLPKTNLLNNNNNEITYYGFIADEIVRFINIRNYLLSSNEYLILDDLQYNLQDTEIILLKDMIKEYLNDNRNAVKTNSFVKSITYDYANIKHGNTSIKSDLITKKISKPFLIMNYKNTTGNWPIKKLPNNLFLIIDIVFDDLFLKLINTYTKKNYNLLEIKKLLIKLYTRGNIPFEIILKRFKQDGKKKFVKMLENGEVILENLILSENYYLSNIDIILLALHFKMPIFMIAVKSFNDTNKETTNFSLNLNNASYTYMIRRGAISDNKPSIYKVFTRGNKNENIHIPLTDYSQELQQQMRQNNITLDTILQTL